MFSERFGGGTDSGVEQQLGNLLVQWTITIRDLWIWDLVPEITKNNGKLPLEIPLNPIMY